MLDTSTLPEQLYPNNVIQWIELSDVPGQRTLPLLASPASHPDPTPNQMLLYRISGTRRSLFIAGGTAGLYQLDLDRRVFNDPPPSPPIVPPLAHTLTALSGPVGDPGTWRWKRCLDLGIVEQPQRKLLFALFAASQQHSPPSIGATELHAYEIQANGPATFYGKYVFNVQGDTRDIIGTAIAADPGDSQSLYVALGIRWLWRVDISSVSGGFFPSAHELTLSSSPPVLPCNDQPSSCPAGERMRDLAIVRWTGPSGSRALAYAALDYGRLLEIELPPPGQTQANVMSVYAPPCHYGERVAAVVDPQNNVLVAFGKQNLVSAGAESRAPYWPTGIWTTPCVASGLADPNRIDLAPNPHPPCPEIGGAIQILRRTPTSPLAPMSLGAQPGVMDTPGILTSVKWGGLFLRRIDTDRFRVFESTSDGGFAVHEISHDPVPAGAGAMTTGTPVPPHSQPWTLLTRSRYKGPAEGASDGILSAADDRLTFFGTETVASYPSEGAMLRIVQNAGIYDIVPVANTVSACASRTEPLLPVNCNSPNPLPPPFTGERCGEPNPFRGGIMGNASWIDPWEGTEPDDPQHPVREWFLGGARAVRGGGCSVPTCANPIDPCFTNPCATAPFSSWRGTRLASFDVYLCPPYDTVTYMDYLDQNRVGWRFTLLDPHAQRGDQMEMRWWQVASPTQNPSDKTETIDLLYAANDPRYDSISVNWAPVPQLVHGVRGGSEWGYKVMSPRAYMQKARELCPTSLPDDIGRGQELLSDPLPGPSPRPAYYEMRTHVELEPLPPQVPALEPCGINVTSVCPGVGPSNRQLFNNKSDTFELVTADYGTRFVTAVASGFVATGPLGPGVDCQWTGHSGQLLVTFFDVTATPGDARGLGAQPQLLRVGLGPVGAHAFALRAKTYADGSTYVFVADLLGRLFVFNVSGDLLFPPASDPYLPVGCQPACTPILIPVAQLDFPADLFDGWKPNCVDIEIDGDVAYCALSRAGIALVDIQLPLYPALLMILDTPGLAQGITFRGSGESRQMLVGDSRAGMRLYGRY